RAGRYLDRGQRRAAARRAALPGAAQGRRTDSRPRPHRLRVHQSRLGPCRADARQLRARLRADAAPDPEDQKLTRTNASGPLILIPNTPGVDPPRRTSEVRIEVYPRPSARLGLKRYCTSSSRSADQPRHRRRFTRRTAAPAFAARRPGPAHRRAAKVWLLKTTSWARTSLPERSASK